MLPANNNTSGSFKFTLKFKTPHAQEQPSSQSAPALIMQDIQNKRKREDDLTSTDNSIRNSNKKIKSSADSQPQKQLPDEEIKIKCLEILTRQAQQEQKAAASQTQVGIEIFERDTLELHALKSEIKCDDAFLKSATSEDAMEKIQWLLEIVNLKPTTVEAMEFELTLLKKIEEACSAMVKSRNLDQKLFANEVLDKLKSTIYPDITYQHATLLSEKTAQEINRLRKDNLNCSEEQKCTNWMTVISLLKADLKRFNLAHKKLGQESFLAPYTLKAIAACYEELADTYLDSFSDFPLDKHCEKLAYASQHYSEARGIYESLDDSKKINDIELSLLNVKFELATVLVERDAKQDEKEALRYFKEILSFAKANLTGRITEKNYVLVFYRLACLHALLKRTSDRPKVLKCAQDVWIRFSKDPFLKSSPKGGNYVVIGWLNQFAPLFEIDPKQLQHLKIPSNFSMCKFGEENYAEFRKKQLLEGLKKLTDDNFSSTCKIELRAHQIEAFKCMSQSLSQQEASGGYLGLPTGAGKTYIMLMQTLATQMPTLIIVPNILLMDQTIENLKKISPKTIVSRFDGKAKDCFAGQVLVTTYQSLELDFKRPQPRLPLKEFGLVWADEAHSCLTIARASVINELKKSACVIGLTATDHFNTQRHKGAFSQVSEVFGECFFQIDLESLINKKMLCPVKNVIVNSKHILMKPTKKKVNGLDTQTDFNEAELSKAINNDAINDSVSDIYLNEVDPATGKRIFGKSALVFCSGIQHAEAVVKNLNATLPTREGKHPWAACIHSNVSRSKQAEIIQLHKEGHTPILVGDKIFNEGYDNPAEEIGFLIRPTKSLVLETQRAGRLLRPHSGKPKALIFEWKYPGLEDQLFFHDLVNGKRSIGIDESSEAQNMPQQQVEKRAKKGYSVDWSTEIPKKVNALEIEVNAERVKSCLNQKIQKSNLSDLSMGSIHRPKPTAAVATPQIARIVPQIPTRIVPQAPARIIPAPKTHNLSFLNPTKVLESPIVPKSTINPAFPPKMKLQVKSQIKTQVRPQLTPQVRPQQNSQITPQNKISFAREPLNEFFLERMSESTEFFAPASNFYPDFETDLDISQEMVHPAETAKENGVFSSEFTQFSKQLPTQVPLIRSTIAERNITPGRITLKKSIEDVMEADSMVIHGGFEPNAPVQNLQIDLSGQPEAQMDIEIESTFDNSFESILSGFEPPFQAEFSMLDDFNFSNGGS